MKWMFIDATFRNRHSRHRTTRSRKNCTIITVTFYPFWVSKNSVENIVTFTSKINVSFWTSDTLEQKLKRRLYSKTCLKKRNCIKQITHELSNLHRWSKTVASLPSNVNVFRLTHLVRRLFSCMPQIQFSNSSNTVHAISANTKYGYPRDINYTKSATRHFAKFWDTSLEENHAPTEPWALHG